MHCLHLMEFSLKGDVPVAAAPAEKLGAPGDRHHPMTAASVRRMVARKARVYDARREIPSLSPPRESSQEGQILASGSAAVALRRVW